MKHETYEEFIKKFERSTAKTTDDCYTPQWLMERIEDFVSKRYGIPKEKMVRPFYPGGDYEHEEYEDDQVVVDNPPFSITRKILRFYTEHNIKYFLFAPGLALQCNVIPNCSQFILKEPITYENGAKVPTSFVTNLEKEPVLTRVSIPELGKPKREVKVPVPEYVITASKVKTYGGRYYLKDYKKTNLNVYGGGIEPIC